MKPADHFQAGLLRLREEFDLRLHDALQGVQCGLSLASEQALADEAVRRGAYRNADDALTTLAQAQREFATWGVTWSHDDLLPDTPPDHEALIAFAEKWGLSSSVARVVQSLPAS